MDVDPGDTAVVATGGARHPNRGDGCRAALVKFSFLAHSVLYSDDVVAAIAGPRRGHT
jgi:hypothetical protein